MVGPVVQVGGGGVSCGGGGGVYLVGDLGKLVKRKKFKAKVKVAQKSRN